MAKTVQNGAAVLLALVLAALLAAMVLAGAPASAHASEDADAAAEVSDDGEAQEASFQVDVDGVDVWFTPTGDGTVAVGRGNAQGGTDFAVDASYAGELVLPEAVEYEGTVYTVTSIEAFAFGSGSTDACSITAVSIPATVVEIGQAAFMGCTDLARLDLPEDGVLTTIGTSAFQRCFALEEVAFPASVVTVGDYAFSYCTSLRSATFAEGSLIETLGSGAFRCNASMPGALETFEYPAVDTIASYVLSFQVNLTSITFLGESYAYFGTEALRGCSSLTYLEIPVLTGAESILDQPARLQLMCIGECTSLETVVFKGDADQYIIWAVSDEQHPFYLDAAISTVVWYGTPWGGTSQNQGGGDSLAAGETIDPAALFPYSEETVNVYFKVDFYASYDDASEGEEPLVSAFLRSDVTPRQLNEGTVEDDQVLGMDASDLPQAEVAWAVEGHAADENLQQGCIAYDADEDDIASCAVVLDESSFLEGLEEVDPIYTVTASDGTELVEGVDYETFFAQLVDGELVEVDYDAIQEAGVYRLVFTGIGDYDGTCVATFSVVEVSLDGSLLGTASDEVAAAMSAELYPDGCSTAILVNGDDARYVAVALGLARVLDVPILLTGTDVLGDATASELRRLEATSVIVVGDQDTIAETVREELAALRTSPSVSRISVASPQEAAVQLYRQFAADGVGADGTAYVVASDDGVLAEAVAAAAYSEAAPVFFADEDGTLDGATRSVLKTSGFSQIVVAAADDEATAWVVEQIGNLSMEVETVVGDLDDLVYEVYVQAVEDGTAAGVCIVPADSDPTLLVLAGYYAGASEIVPALVGDISDEADAVLAFLEEHATSVDTVRFAFSDGSFPLDDVNRIVGVWGASFDESGIFTSGSEEN